MPQHALFGEIAGGTPSGGKHALYPELTGGSATGGKHGHRSEIPPSGSPVAHVAGSGHGFWSGMDIGPVNTPFDDTQEGDCMVVVLGRDIAGTWTPPSSGWVPILSSSEGGVSIDSYYKFATASDIADYGAWTLPGGSAHTACVWNCFRNVNATTPIATSGHGTGTGAMPALAGVVNGFYYVAGYTTGSGSGSGGNPFTPSLFNGAGAQSGPSDMESGAVATTSTASIGGGYSFTPTRIWATVAGFAAQAMILQP